MLAVKVYIDIAISHDVILLVSSSPFSSSSSFSLFTEERKLGLEEKPLLVQLNWHIDDREGRFLLRRIDDKTNAQGVGFSSSDGSSFRRKLSKREKKQMKKQEKLSRLKSLEQDENTIPVDQNGVAEKLYTGEWITNDICRYIVDISSELYI